MKTKIYGQALQARLKQPDPIVLIVHDIVRLCRKHGGTLVQKDQKFVLNYRGTCRAASSLGEMIELKKAFI